MRKAAPRQRTVATSSPFFSNNSPYGEQIRYALSDDGFNYTSLNEGRPVVASDTVALKKSIRDPYITRGRDGKTFYMVTTDMRSDEGWQSNDGLILMKSSDLIHWQHTAIDFPTRFPDLAGFDRENLHAVWAPQVIWDDEVGKYMIYYSIGRHDWEYPTEDLNFKQPHFKLFYSYVNEDFTDITTPKLLFDFGTAAIDGDIVRNPKTGEFVLFFKDEGRSVMNKGFRTRQGVMRATSQRLTGPYSIEWRHLQKEGQYPVEGSSVFPPHRFGRVCADVRLLRTRLLPVLQEQRPAALHFRAEHQNARRLHPPAWIGDAHIGGRARAARGVVGPQHRGGKAAHAPRADPDAETAGAAAGAAGRSPAGAQHDDRRQGLAIHDAES